MKQGKLGPRSRYEVAILAHQILGGVFLCSRNKLNVNTQGFLPSGFRNGTHIITLL